jgi:hypothetical protein
VRSGIRTAGVMHRCPLTPDNTLCYLTLYGLFAMGAAPEAFGIYMYVLYGSTSCFRDRQPVPTLVRSLQRYTLFSRLLMVCEDDCQMNITCFMHTSRLGLAQIRAISTSNASRILIL